MSSAEPAHPNRFSQWSASQVTARPYCRAATRLDRHRPTRKSARTLALVIDATSLGTRLFPCTSLISFVEKRIW